MSHERICGSFLSLRYTNFLIIIIIIIIIKAVKYREGECLIEMY